MRYLKEDSLLTIVQAGMDGGIEAVMLAMRLLCPQRQMFVLITIKLKIMKNNHCHRSICLCQKYMILSLYPIIGSNKRHLILGGEANLWTEYIQTTNQAEYMLFQDYMRFLRWFDSKNKKRLY